MRSNSNRVLCFLTSAPTPALTRCLSPAGSGAPAAFGATAAWLGGLARGSYPQTGAARGFGIVGLVVVIALVATMIGVAEHFAKIPKAQRRRTLMFVGIPGHHGVNDVGVAWMTANLDKSLAKTVFVMNGEHTAAGQFYLWGPVIRRANMGLAFFWRVNGSPTLEQILRRSFRTFGVPTFAEPSSSARNAASSKRR